MKKQLSSRAEPVIPTERIREWRDLLGSKDPSTSLRFARDDNGVGMTKRGMGIVVVLLVTALAYGNIFRNTFVIDDQYFIVEKSANPVSQQGVFRPIRSLLYTTYFQIFGTTNPTGYHLHSLAVHLASTILVYLIISVIARSIRRSNPVSGSPLPRNTRDRDDREGMLPFIAALLFALHPIHTESITYIAASMEMTGVVFFLASFWLYLDRHAGTLAMTMSVIFAFLAFFTYEMTLTLPLLLLLYEMTLGNKNWRKIIPIGIMAGMYVFVRIGVAHVGVARGDYLAFSPYHTWLTMTKMVVKYIWLLIWPVALSHNQTIVPGFEAFMTPYSDQAAILSQSIFDPEILFSIGLIGLICLIGLKLVKKHPLVSFGIGWFFISLLPVLYIFPQGTAFAEKYLYIPSIGFVLLVGCILSSLRGPKGRSNPVSGSPREYARDDGWRGMGGVIVILLVLFYGVRTAVRNRDWRSPRTLWEHETKIHPQSELAYYNLGIYYAQNGQREKAIESYQKALNLKPQFWQAENNLRNLLK